MHTEAKRRDAEIKANRMWEQSRIAVDVGTADLLQRVGVKFMLQSIGIEAATPGEMDAAAQRLPLGRLEARQACAPEGWAWDAHWDE